MRFGFGNGSIVDQQRPVAGMAGKTLAVGGLDIGLGRDIKAQAVIGRRQCLVKMLQYDMIC